MTAAVPADIPPAPTASSDRNGNTARVDGPYLCGFVIAILLRAQEDENLSILPRRFLLGIIELERESTTGWNTHKHYVHRFGSGRQPRVRAEVVRESTLMGLPTSNIASAGCGSGRTIASSDCSLHGFGLLVIPRPLLSADTCHIQTVFTHYLFRQKSSMKFLLLQNKGKNFGICIEELHVK